VSAGGVTGLGGIYPPPLLIGFIMRKQENRLSCGGMEFATEIIGKFALSGAEIAEIPVTLSPDGRGGRSHLRTLRDGLRHIRYIFFGSRA
ncbi:MAG: hypothetical protein KIG62_07905, partial [Oscillospiraceae bacterium]|nr:hypothetical protein [Oscillospiraceae bacterium]